MTQQPERIDRAIVPTDALDAMRQGEADRLWLAEHPEILEPYRGEWVAVHKGRVVAHSPDGPDVGRQVSAGDYPGCLFFRVSTHEEAEAVRTL